MTILATFANVSIPMGVKKRLYEKSEGRRLWSQIEEAWAQTIHVQNDGPIKFEVLFRSGHGNIMFANTFTTVVLGLAEPDSHPTPPSGRNDGNKECHKCRGRGHFAKNCPHERFSLPTKYATCRTCGQEGHSRADCPSRRCKRCYVIGHSANECTAPYCTRCRQPGHAREGCNSAPPKCDDCGGVHPTIHCELFTNEKRKRRNQAEW